MKIQEEVRVVWRPALPIKGNLCMLCAVKGWRRSLLLRYIFHLRQNLKIRMSGVNMNTKCNFCGNKNFKNVKVQYVYKHDNKFLIVDDVPCEQCEYCGEQYFEGKVLTRIEEEFQRIHVQGKKPLQELRVPIEQFAQI